MFDPASLLFCRFKINASGHKLLHKKSVPLIDFLGNLLTYGGQMEKSIVIKKNTNTLKSIVTIPIMINIMEVKLFEIGLST